MRAILIKRDGFRKYIEVRERQPIVRIHGIDSVSIYPLDKVLAENTKLPITEYYYVREFQDEFDNHVPIHKEMP